ncbi:MAG: hypothetical protein KA010_04280 [Saprospiraceae bacterium]|nr:hypothetical protein [Saprospiraceae bacterium]
MKTPSFYSKFKKIAIAILFCSVISEANAAVVYSTPLNGETFQIGNLLEWGTATELNSLMFVVERSLDGIDFSNIGVIEAAGSSSRLKNYTFLDVESKDVQTYYRLKQVDIDGTTSYSATVIVKNDYPNNFIIVSMTQTTTNNDFSITLDASVQEEMTYSVVSYKGEKMYENKQKLVNGMNDITVKLEDYKEGIYRINLKLGEEVESLVVRKLDDEVKKKDNVASKNGRVNKN